MAGESPTLKQEDIEELPPCSAGARFRHGERARPVAGRGRRRRSRFFLRGQSGAPPAAAATATIDPPRPVHPSRGSAAREWETMSIFCLRRPNRPSLPSPSRWRQGFLDWPPSSSRTSPCASGEKATLELLKDVELDLRIELGRTHMYLEDVLKLKRGSVVTLEKLAGDPVDVFVNGRLVARGEVLVLNDNFCVVV